MFQLVSCFTIKFEFGDLVLSNSIQGSLFPIQFMRSATCVKPSIRIQRILRSKCARPLLAVTANPIDWI